MGAYFIFSITRSRYRGMAMVQSPQPILTFSIMTLCIEMAALAPLKKKKKSPPSASSTSEK